MDFINIQGIILFLRDHYLTILKIIFPTGSLYLIYQWIIKMKKEKIIVYIFIKDKILSPLLYNSFDGANISFSRGLMTILNQINEYQEKIKTVTPDQLKCNFALPAYWQWNEIERLSETNLQGVIIWLPYRLKNAIIKYDKLFKNIWDQLNKIMKNYKQEYEQQKQFIKLLEQLKQPTENMILLINKNKDSFPYFCLSNFPLIRYLFKIKFIDNLSIFGG